VLVHGLYADGSCWSGVIKRLHRPTVLVAHSYRGDGRHAGRASRPTQAKTTPLAAKFPTPPAVSGFVVRDGLELLGESAFLNDFANGVERQRRDY